MNYSIAIVGEAWEAVFARATATSLAQWMPPRTDVLVPAELARAVSDVIPGSVRRVHPETAGFQQYAEVRNRMLRAAGDRVLLIAAGVLPKTREPIERLGAPYCSPRTVEWISSGSSPTILHFEPPAHCPPTEPQHQVRRIGALDFWEVAGGGRYFQALIELETSGAPPVWKSYGRGEPVFIYNTNDFDEPSVSAHECYVVLASGLLGLRLVVESNPAPGAKVIVYDINPSQLTWIQHVLRHAGDAPLFEGLVAGFSSEYPEIEHRTLQPHEQVNARKQADWYHQNYQRISSIAQKLQWEFVECDILAHPGSLLRRLDSGRSTCFMYLDLFVVWNIDGKAPWVEHHAGMALSLESLLRERLRRPLCFVPGMKSTRFQLSPTSPFWRDAI